MLQKLETELKLRGFSQRTIKAYTFHNQKFIDFIKKEPNSIIEEDIKTYLAYLISERNISPASIALTKAALKFYYNDVLTKDIVKNIKTPKIVRKIPEVLTKEEVKKLIAAAENPRDKLLIEFMYSSGVRVSECINLKKKNIDIDKKEGWVRRGKGGKDRFILISDQIVGDLRGYLSTVPGDYIFPGKKGPLSVRNVQKIIKKLACNANIKKRVYCHGLRHAFATHLLESGVDIRKIQELLAHSNIQTTQIYTKVSTEELKKVKSPLDML